MYLEHQYSEISKKEYQEIFHSFMMEFKRLKAEEEKNKPKHWQSIVDYDIRQIAKYLGITAQTIRNYIDRLHLEYKLEGGKIVLSYEVADKIIKIVETKKK